MGRETERQRNKSEKQQSRKRETLKGRLKPGVPKL